MPAKLTTTVSKIAQVPNKTNSAIIEEFYAHMKAKGSSEQHQNNILKTVIAYANFLGSETTFFDVQQKARLLHLGDMTNRLSSDEDKKLIAIWKLQIYDSLIHDLNVVKTHTKHAHTH